MYIIDPGGGEESGGDRELTRMILGLSTAGLGSGVEERGAAAKS